MKIYTKTGDHGETGLLGGIRVSKSHRAVEVCGTLDETSSLLGLAVSYGMDDALSDVLSGIQNDLFDLGSRVAACQSETSRAAEFPESQINKLESCIDRFEHGLEELREFILPGGCQAGAALHLARAVCRRSERELVALIESPDSGLADRLARELVYLNRLGDLLFVMARRANQEAGVSETRWVVSKP